MDDNAQSLTRLGLTLQRQGKFEDAVRAFGRALALEPQHAGLYVNLGAVLNDLGRHGAALDILVSGLQLAPRMAELHNDIGFALRHLNRIEEAADAFRRAAALAPADPAPALNLGLVLTLLCRFDEGIAAYRRAYARHPRLARSGGNLLYTMSYHPTMPAADIAAEFRAWGAYMCAAPTPRAQASPTARVRIGYVSPDFRNHTTRFYLLPLLRHLDRAWFELFAYSNVARPDAHTEQMRPLFDHWYDIHGIDDRDAATLIRSHGLDLLVDLTSHMEANRLGIFARRAARAQATWLGSCWTSGLPTMDYAIHDHHTAPPGADALFVERVWRLPQTLFCFQPDDLPPPTPLPAMRNGYVTFGYSGRSERLNPLVFEAWGEILRRLPTARLVLDFGCFGDRKTADTFTRMLGAAGVDVARVTLRGSAGAQAALAEIDILLDSFPHSGGTMLFDAIWAGVPIVTLAARPPVGRIGTCIMANLDLAEWIAKDTEAYIAIATEMAGRDLAALRSSLRRRADASPLGNAALFAQHMGQAYRDMVTSLSEEAVTMINERPE